MSGITQIVGTEDNGTSKTVYVNSSNALKTFSITDDAIVTNDSEVIIASQKGIALMGFAGTQSVVANDACMLACSTTGRLEVSLKETINVPVTNAGLTELASAINSDKVDVNIVSGGDLSARTNILTPSTSTKLLCDDAGHLQVDIVKNTTTLTFGSMVENGVASLPSAGLLLDNNSTYITYFVKASVSAPAIPSSNFEVNLEFSPDGENWFTRGNLNESPPAYDNGISYNNSGSPMEYGPTFSKNMNGAVGTDTTVISYQSSSLITLYGNSIKEGKYVRITITNNASTQTFAGWIIQ